MSLYEIFKRIKDPRRKQGLRTNLPQLFCMIVVSNLCGYFGGRPISKFAKSHEHVFNTELDLKHSIPSHTTFSDILNRVDDSEMISAFNSWAAGYVPLRPMEAVSGDGKALASTVGDAQGPGQDFQAVVSLFCQESGLVRSLERYRNAKESEIDVVHLLIKELKDMGLTFYLDALHAQKNS